MLDHKDSPYIRAVRSRGRADGTVPGWGLGEQRSRRCDIHSADSAATLLAVPGSGGLPLPSLHVQPTVHLGVVLVLPRRRRGRWRAWRGAAGGLKGGLTARLTASAFQCERECVVTILWPCASSHILHPLPRRSSRPARRALARRSPWACLSGTFSSTRCAGQIVRERERLVLDPRRAGRCLRGVLSARSASLGPLEPGMFGSALVVCTQSDWLLSGLHPQRVVPRSNGARPLSRV